MAHLFLEDFVESILDLPREVRAKLEEIREKDVSFYEQRRSAIRRQSSYFKSTKQQGKVDGFESMPLKVRSEYNKCLELMNEKIDEDTQAYEIFDRHIKRLDHDLKQFEIEMEEEKLKLERAGLEDKRVPKRKVAAVEDPPKPLQKKRKNEFEAEQADTSVDPNEPLYCICQQISFGEMIACDNQSKTSPCPYEWFHYQCVGLTTQPKGKWFCSECLCKMRKLTPS